MYASTVLSPLSPLSLLSARAPRSNSCRHRGLVDCSRRTSWIWCTLTSLIWSDEVPFWNGNGIRPLTVVKKPRAISIIDAESECFSVNKSSNLVATSSRLSLETGQHRHWHEFFHIIYTIWRFYVISAENRLLHEFLCCSKPTVVDSVVWQNVGCCCWLLTLLLLLWWYGPPTLGCLEWTVDCHFVRHPLSRDKQKGSYWSASSWQFAR